MKEEETLRFYSGDVVVLKRMNSPEMLITNKVFLEEDGKKSISFQCGWFNNSNQWLTTIFDARDLLKIKSNKDGHSEI